MISINRCRNTVLFLLDKNNRAFISPMEFDSFCHLAQLELFENLFFQYNKWISNQSRHLSNSGFADIPKNIQEQIDSFSEFSTTSNFIYDSVNDVWEFSGTDLYRTSGLSFVNASGKKVDCEEVPKGIIWNNMVNSKLNAPTTLYPIYTKIGSGYRTFPIATTGYSVELLYIRTPKAPKWSYITDFKGNPSFNAGATDRQDIELDESLFYPLVMKILSFCGLSIQQEEVIQAADKAEVVTDQKHS